MKTLRALLLSGLADLYEAENRLAQSLPKWVKAATNNELREALHSHLAETIAHATKLEMVFQLFGESARGKKCQAFASLLQEADETAFDHKFAPTLNAALIFAAQKVEHYEIASYGGLREWAGQLGNQPAVELLQEILDEEQATDQKLTEVARQHCNPPAQNGDFDATDSCAEVNGSYVVTRPALIRMKALAKAGIGQLAESRARQVRNKLRSMNFPHRAMVDLVPSRSFANSKV